MIAVVDASVALKWLFNERTDEPSRAAPTCLPSSSAP